MNNKSQKPVANPVPDWWQHSIQAWIDLSHLFSDEALTNRLNWQKLTEGQSNHNYKLSLTNNPNKKFYFVQIINLANLAMLPQGEENQNFPQVSIYLANNTSIKPWLVDCYLSTNSVRVFEWIDFEPVTIELFESGGGQTFDLDPSVFTGEQFLLSVADFMASLHKIRPSSAAPPKAVKIDIQQHLKRYHQRALIKAPEYAKPIERLLQQSLPIAEQFSPDALCHNDLSLNNLLWSSEQGQLKVIDWEYACYSDPIMDLAGFLLNFQLSNKQQQKFLELYSNKTGFVISPNKLKNMRLLCQNISTLWQFCTTG